MKMNTAKTPLQWPVALLFVLASGGFAHAGERSTQTIGEAFDLDSGELLYSETHCVSADQSRREVFYSDRDGILLARKLLDYRSGAITPSFEQQNYYSSESISVALRNQQLTMEVVDAKTLETRSEVSVTPENELPVVIDAGFDAFVRQHWDSLIDGETQRFQFPFADRESLVALRISGRTCSYDSETDQCFRLDLSNWFLRVLVEPIELGYDSDSRQLTRYRGLSNIGDANGNGLVVDLRYEYRDFPENACQAMLPMPDDSKDRAYAVPLAAIN